MDAIKVHNHLAFCRHLANAWLIVKSSHIPSYHHRFFLINCAVGTFFKVVKLACEFSTLLQRTLMLFRFLEFWMRSEAQSYCMLRVSDLLIHLHASGVENGVPLSCTAGLMAYAARGPCTFQCSTQAILDQLSWHLVWTMGSVSCKEVMLPCWR